VACNASISHIAQGTPVAYDPFEGLARSATLDIEFVNAGDSPCTLGVAVARQETGGERRLKSSHSEVPYRVTGPGGVELANDLSAPWGSVVLAGGAGQRQTFSLKVEVPAGFIVPAGTYADMLSIRAFDLDNASRVAMGSDRSVRALAIVASRAQINLAGGAGSQGTSFGLDRMDFGVLQSGAERQAFVQIRSTSAVTIQISSKNRGMLRHLALRDRVPGIAYTLRLDGTEASLDTGSFSMERNPPVSISGASYMLNVRIGDVTHAYAGDYQDVVTISVCPH
jgi:hypothetical protein